MNPSATAQIPNSVPKANLARNLLLSVLGGFLIATQTATPAMSATMHQAQSQPDIHKLIRNMAWNELQAAERPAHYYRYISREVSPGEARTTEQIQTAQGIAELLLTVNGKPPTPEQRQANNNLLARLTTDARFRQSRLRNHRQDTARRDSIIKNLPEAFIYTFMGKSKDGLIHLKFRPDPQFNPSSRQAVILEGMEGELWVDPSSQRMVKIDGRLIKDVTIGWGFLARLYKGGRFLMEQSKGSDGMWHQELLSVDFDGTELIFKALHVHEKLIRCCFERVPHNLTIKQAVHRLQENPDLPAHWDSKLKAIEKSDGSY